MLAAACGGDRRAAAPSTGDDQRAGAPPVARAEAEADDGLEVDGLRASLEADQIEEGVRPHQRALTACYQGQLRGARFLGGSVELAFVVTPAGEVGDVRLSRADLGSWAVERCLLGVARAMRFASPRGKGDAEFTLPLEFENRRPVVWWQEERADQEVAKHLPDLAPCDDDGGATDVSVTLYIGNRGHVKSVGFASPSASIPEAWATCASAAIGGWALSDPRGKIAKAGFHYRPD